MWFHILVGVSDYCSMSYFIDMLCFRGTDGTDDWQGRSRFKDCFLHQVLHHLRLIRTTWEVATRLPFSYVINLFKMNRCERASCFKNFNSLILDSYHPRLYKVVDDFSKLLEENHQVSWLHYTQQWEEINFVILDKFFTVIVKFPSQLWTVKTVKYYHRRVDVPLIPRPQF